MQTDTRDYYLVGGTLDGRSGAALLADERFVYVGDDTAARDCGLDEAVQLFVSADGQLQMARRDALHLQVLGRVARQLQHLQATDTRITFCFPAKTTYHSP